MSLDASDVTHLEIDSMAAELRLDRGEERARGESPAERCSVALRLVESSERRERGDAQDLALLDERPSRVLALVTGDELELMPRVSAG